MRILNLYAGLGGNRPAFGNNHQVTAVEIDPAIAEVYRQRFPSDTVIVADAHQYLLEHYQEFDFIWTSPPCQTHSRLAMFNKSPEKRNRIKYPDCKLWQEILLLKHYFAGDWIVENTISYYKPLIAPVVAMQHYIWSNLPIEPKATPHATRGHSAKLADLAILKNIDYSLLAGIGNKKTALRNMVEQKLAEYLMGYVNKSSLCKQKGKNENNNRF